MEAKKCFSGDPLSEQVKLCLCPSRRLECDALEAERVCVRIHEPLPSHLKSLIC